LRATPLRALKPPTVTGYDTSNGLDPGETFDHELRDESVTSRSPDSAVTGLILRCGDASSCGCGDASTVLTNL